MVRPVVAQNTRGQIMILDTGDEGERPEVRVGGNIGRINDIANASHF